MAHEHEHHWHTKREDAGKYPCGGPMTEVLMRCCVCGMTPYGAYVERRARMSFWEKISDISDSL